MPFLVPNKPQVNKMERRNFLKSLAGTALLAGSEVQAQAKRIITASPQNLTPPMQEASLWATGIDEADTSRLRIGIVATGGGACNTLASYVGEFPGLTRMIAIDTSESTLRKLPNATHILLRDNDRFPGHPLMASELGEAARPVIAQALAGLDLVFILASLGGTVGSSMAPMIARITSESGIPSVGAAILPFGWEGEAKLASAANAASAMLQNGVMTLFPLDNDEIANSFGPQITPQSVFDVASQNFAALYRGIVIPLVEPGIIGIDLADVLHVLNQPGMSACGHGVATGPGAAALACSQAIESPWLGRGRLNAASHILVHIEGDETLTLTDFRAVCELVRLHCIEDAVVRVSFQTRDVPAGSCRVTLLATGVRV